MLSDEENLGNTFKAVKNEGSDYGMKTIFENEQGCECYLEWMATPIDSSNWLCVTVIAYESQIGMETFVSK